ncbi:hypothetical protein MA16_Dca008629 [Dendrobium catenatum]|uniref:Uncharacterized protein n=1 Tax=Dendrobium catenatum TaxID=906689 RepID=A0A2I0WA90_9ASPA|nr:hypothetical protein MA16_Dca008629 [Dendrobium catenatum]
MNCSKGDVNLSKLAIINEEQPTVVKSVSANEEREGSVAEIGDKYGPWIHVRYGKKTFRNGKPRLLNQESYKDNVSRKEEVVSKVDVHKKLNVAVNSISGSELETQKFSGKEIANAGILCADIDSQGIKVNGDPESMANNVEFRTKKTVDKKVTDEATLPINKMSTDPIAGMDLNSVDFIVNKNRFDILNSTVEEGEIVVADKDNGNGILNSNAGTKLPMI